MSRPGRKQLYALTAFVLAAGPILTPSSAAMAAEEAASASAVETAQSTESPLVAELDLMGRRLRRGTANAGLGWLEIPAGVQEIGNQHGIGAAATWGLVHGSGRAVQRTAVGLFEILTFPFKLTQNNKPIIEPEFVLDKPDPESPTPDPATTTPSP